MILFIGFYIVRVVGMVALYRHHMDFRYYTISMVRYWQNIH